MKKVGNYYGLVASNGDENGYIRTSLNGFIPYATGGASNVGTSSWLFNNIYGKSIYNDGKKIPKLYTGSIVRTIAAGADSVIAWTAAQYQSTFGIAYASTHYVNFGNGDAGANPAHIDGANYLSGSLYAVLGAKVTTAQTIRLNYLVVIP